MFFGNKSLISLNFPSLWVPIKNFINFIHKDLEINCNDYIENMSNLNDQDKIKEKGDKKIRKKRRKRSKKSLKERRR